MGKLFSSLHNVSAFTVKSCKNELLGLPSSVSAHINTRLIQSFRKFIYGSFNKICEFFKITGQNQITIYSTLNGGLYVLLLTSPFKPFSV
jgi:hypothetical protein